MLSVHSVADALVQLYQRDFPKGVAYLILSVVCIEILADLPGPL
jgi:hypothetical protein